MKNIKLYDKLYIATGGLHEKKLLLILMMITIFTTGCNKLSESEEFVQGQEKLESHQYNEALTLLSQVLNEDPDNSSARSMYMQARKMQSAQEYENNQDYIRAIRELETIVNINDGSKQIKREAINKMKRQLMEWEKIFANHISDKRLLSKIYKEYI